MRTRSLFNDHNVYILGAGFSRPAGLPLMRDFLMQMRDYCTDFRDDEEAEQAIGAVLEFTKTSSLAAYRVLFDPQNVEELFSIASAIGDRDLIKNFRMAISCTLHSAMKRAPKRQYISMQVSTLLANRNRWEPYTGSVAAGLQPGTRAARIPVYSHFSQVISQSNAYEDNVSRDTKNTVITFNYDTLLEDAMRGMNRKYDHLYDSHGNGLCILKPHGSLSWTTQKGPDTADLIDLNKDPLIVPPTWNKSLNGHLESTWKDCVKALRDATRIIVVGFSFPKTDFHIKYMIASGLMENISLREIVVVDPYIENVRENVQQILRSDLASTAIRYWGGEQHGRLCGAAEYFWDEQEMKRISRPLAYKFNHME